MDKEKAVLLWYNVVCKLPSTTIFTDNGYISLNTDNIPDLSINCLMVISTLWGLIFTPLVCKNPMSNNTTISPNFSL